MSTSYVFRAELTREEDGRWSAAIPALPGCAAWGHTREEALDALRDAAEVYVEDMIEAGEPLPTEGVYRVEAPVVAITR